MKKGTHHTKEAIEKNRQAKLKNPTKYWLGKKRKDMIGNKFAEGVSYKKGKTYEDIFGKVKAEDVKEKLRISHIGHKPSEKQRKVSSERWKGENNPRWTGGQYKDKHGYKWVHDYKNRWRKEHRVVVEKIIGRDLKRSETIHHIDENKLNNKTENLYYFPNDNLHKRHHGLKDKPKLKSNVNNITNEKDNYNNRS